MTAAALPHDLTRGTSAGHLSPGPAHPTRTTHLPQGPGDPRIAYLSPGTPRPRTDLSPRPARPRLSPGTAALALLLACGPAPALPDAAGPAAPLALPAGTPVAYVLDWSWDGARRDGDAHVFTTDRGYTVALETAYLATGRAELVPCTDASSLADAVSSLLVPAAHAAHSRTGDPSAVTAPVVESVHAAAPHLLGRGFAGGAAYCGVHVLGVPVAAAAADGFALARETLVLTGHWTAPGGHERRPLRASINLQDGSLRPLSGWTTFPVAHAPPSARVAVVLTRHPARAFDRLDLAALGDTDLAFAVLGNLLQGTDAKIATR
jgi:hypothetical protein